MQKILIVTDSASDLSEKDERELGIRVLPYKLMLDGKEYISRVELDNETFYRMLAGSEGVPTTSQITPFEFVDLYREYWREGYTDVIQILINAAGSSTYQNSVLAVEQFLEEEPEAREQIRIHTLEGKSYTGAYGFAAVQAARMAREGKSTEEILAFVNDWLDHCRIYAGLFTLKYAARSGRIPSVAAFVGDVIGMKPIMRIFDHEITTRDKVRGEKNIIPFIIRKVTAEIVPESPYCVVYGENEADGAEMTAAATAALGYPPADTYRIGPIIASHAGPRVVGLIFRAKK
ncbi:MAG: DegV family protein [Clostridiales bacterium]|nr:MAG: DegV family protein [Clostridiales bacterium]